MDILKENEAGATFFVSGDWVESYPEEVRMILDAGHDLGSLGRTYTDMRDLSDEEREKEILSLHNRVKELTGYEMFLFRPPFGKYDNRVIECAEACDYLTVWGNADSLDWKDYGAEETARAVLQKAQNGSIVIFRVGEADTGEALKTVIRELQERGYEMVSLSDLGIRELLFTAASPAFAK